MNLTYIKLDGETHAIDNSITTVQEMIIEANLFASYFIISDEEIKEINHIPTIAINYNLDYRICEERMRYLI